MHNNLTESARLFGDDGDGGGGGGGGREDHSGDHNDNTWRSSAAFGGMSDGNGNGNGNGDDDVSSSTEAGQNTAQQQQQQQQQKQQQRNRKAGPFGGIVPKNPFDELLDDDAHDDNNNDNDNDGDGRGLLYNGPGGNLLYEGPPASFGDDEQHPPPRRVSPESSFNGGGDYDLSRESERGRFVDMLGGKGGGEGGDVEEGGGGPKNNNDDDEDDDDDDHDDEDESKTPTFKMGHAPSARRRSFIENYGVESDDSYEDEVLDDLASVVSRRSERKKKKGGRCAGCCDAVLGERKTQRRKVSLAIFACMLVLCLATGLVLFFVVKGTTEGGSSDGGGSDGVDDVGAAAPVPGPAPTESDDDDANDTAVGDEFANFSLPLGFPTGSPVDADAPSAQPSVTTDPTGPLVAIVTLSNATEADDEKNGTPSTSPLESRDPTKGPTGSASAAPDGGGDGGIGGAVDSSRTNVDGVDLADVIAVRLYFTEMNLCADANLDMESCLVSTAIDAFVFANDDDDGRSGDYYSAGDVRVLGKGGRRRLSEEYDADDNNNAGLSSGGRDAQEEDDCSAPQPRFGREEEADLRNLLDGAREKCDSGLLLLGKDDAGAGTSPPEAATTTTSQQRSEEFDRALDGFLAIFDADDCRRELCVNGPDETLGRAVSFGVAAECAGVEMTETTTIGPCVLVLAFEAVANGISDASGERTSRGERALEGAASSGCEGRRRPGYDEYLLSFESDVIPMARETCPEDDDARDLDGAASALAAVFSAPGCWVNDYDDDDGRGRGCGEGSTDDNAAVGNDDPGPPDAESPPDPSSPSSSSVPTRAPASTSLAPSANASTTFDPSDPSAALGDISSDDASSDPYILSSSNWGPPSSSFPVSRHGSSVAVSSDGDLIAVGATEATAEGSTAAERVGAAYLYSWEVAAAENDAPLPSSSSPLPLQVVYGGSSGAEFGNSVALSRDGSRLVVGSRSEDRQAGAARIYGRGLRSESSGMESESTPPSWSLMEGGFLAGEMPSERAGWSVSISGDGKVVAMGSPEGGDEGGGSIRTFAYDDPSSTWVPYGSTIQGLTSGEQAGYSIHLSDTGSTMIVGSPKASNPVGLSFAGKTAVYLMSESEWLLAGQVYGEGEGDLDGTSVATSRDGSIVAIGGRGRSEVNTTTGEVLKKSTGHCLVYRVRDGRLEIQHSMVGKVPEERLGSSVAVSLDGNVVACGGVGGTKNGGARSGVVRLWNRDTSRESTIWPRGAVLDTNGATFGASVAVSSDGEYVVVGAPTWSSTNGEATSAGIIQIFRDVS